MDIKIEGNPGTGNTFQEINITGPIQNYVPAATQVINNYYGTDKKESDTEFVTDKETIRRKLLSDMDKLTDMVRNAKQAVWMNLWDDILEMPEVKHEVYNRGHNHDTIYNRKLVAAIVHFVGSSEKDCLQWFSKYNATQITRTLEYKEGASIRGELGRNPSFEIQDALKKLITERYK